MRSVIHDIAAPTRSRETVVYLFRVQIDLLAVQDEVVSFDLQVWCDFPPEHDECEDVAILLKENTFSQCFFLHDYNYEECSNLFLAVLQELNGILTVNDGTPYERDPVENNRWFIFLFKQQLLENIENNSYKKERNYRRQAKYLEREIEQSAREQTHCEKEVDRFLLLQVWTKSAQRGTSK